MLESARRLALALLAQLPLLSALDQWRDEAKESVVATILTCLAYEIIVLIFAFGNEIWLRLKPDVIEYIVNKIKFSVARTSPGFSRRYRRYVITEHSIFNVRGLG